MRLTPSLILGYITDSEFRKWFEFKIYSIADMHSCVYITQVGRSHAHSNESSTCKKREQLKFNKKQEALNLCEPTEPKPSKTRNFYSNPTKWYEVEYKTQFSVK